MSEYVIIVGAPRSGTNMLRDLLTSAPGLGTWDCDEVNLLWKHGNLDVPHDEIGIDRATPDLSAFMRRAFDRVGRRTRSEIVVEKTCAVSLRVPFTRALFPDARYIFIRRDGIDATASTMQRWNAPFELGYTLRKARYVPPLDLPRHAAALVRKRVTQRLRGEVRQDESDLRVGTWWGPRPHDHRRLQREHPLEELAFIQWQRCVEQAAAGLDGLPDDRLIEVVYEDFVTDPRAGTARLLDFLERPQLLADIDTGAVSARSVGKGRQRLGAEAVARLEKLGGETLAKYGRA
ncbi:sulfotransferase [Arthrobacter sp. NEB 688]|uniref:sulfotransferase family protein n=1 Tax=Arthrobacter sp. NEB 688 TaxID=904039 RepID=UPI001566BF68|nr:sulfotransferase [Arthrobacter sp. NEB 688]QKE85635.1 sulfotransferase [Arthrobacter sp. NEB 688]